MLPCDVSGRQHIYDWTSNKPVGFRERGLTSKQLFLLFQELAEEKKERARPRDPRGALKSRRGQKTVPVGSDLGSVIATGTLKKQGKKVVLPKGGLLKQMEMEMKRQNAG